MDRPTSIIADICNELNSTGHAHSPRIELQETFDFQHFKKQESSIEGVECEWVRQSGPGVCGDDFQSTLAVPIDGQFLFVIQCDT